ncbi:MAG TPA: serine/threonine-protein kinase [Polyangiaceae bacterium]|nr:serine/threonine-protein kinase [Polyangiaceae bacterium]
MSDSQQRYRVVEKLESGGMAEVFRAESEGLQGFRKQVAIKRVLPHLSSKKKFISMFLDEARLSAQLSHSNCVQVFDIGVGDSAYFIVMEFVDGANLKSIVDHLKKNGREFPVEAAVYLSLELCKGLAYAHELTDPNGVPLHIVHRDMSPPNVLITKHGEVKIVDFGLAKANSQLEKSEPGIIKGKFSYLSPEAAMAQEVDARTDIFAVGIILWELLAGQRLFLGETDFQTVKKVQASVVPSICQINPRAPAELDRIIQRALARDPAQRYATARALGMDLSKFLFKHAVPVSTFDIATLVQGAMKERQRYRPQQASIIDKLIEEALLEFTSLTDEKSAHPSRPIQIPPLQGARVAGPPSGGYVGSWIDEIAVGTKREDSALHSALPSGLSVGNLAALEDEPLHAPAPPPSPRATGPVPAARSSGSLVGAGPAHAAPPATASSPPPWPADRKPNAATRVGVAVALIVVMAAGAAAWFTHLIPHP